ncbi:Uncharacterized protein APZ42_012211 [Daphnia magna]|uniref:Uncharacterized protein n=1 Tax=Daphnia magna TaxID=35525 RepID=A0A0N8CVD0_9CRUS|nr:Uncharacterized protein APZ42_012211 [Daphnia magna]
MEWLITQMLCKNKGYCSIVINFQHPKCTACSINDVLQELSLSSSIVIREIAAGIHYAGVSKQLLILLQKAIKQYWINGSICYGQPINAHVNPFRRDILFRLKSLVHQVRLIG